MKKLGIGIKLGDHLTSVMAFADDLVLLTERSPHMLVAITECQRFLDQKGLKVNVGNCGSLSVLPVKGKRFMKVVSREHRWWGEFLIPSLDFVKLQKYIGVYIRHDGKMA